MTNKQNIDIPTSIVEDAHAWTRSKASWDLDAYGKKLFRYLSCGGLRDLGRTQEQEDADAKRRRFLAWGAIVAAIWLITLIV